MTRAEFLSAAKKGKGRAILALREGRYSASLHDLRKLVLRWPGHDDYWESYRGWYTAELMNASGRGAELQDVLIRHACRTKGWNWDVAHREKVVEELAIRGVAEAKEAAYRNFDSTDEFRFADAIVMSDGLDGLDWVINHSEGKLAGEDSWRCEGWVSDLAKSIGREAVDDWLSRPENAEFARLANRKAKRTRKTVEAPLTYEQFREEWDSRPGKRPSMHSWIRAAAPDELEKAWRVFEVEQDEVWLRRFSSAIRGKAATLEIEPVLAKARDWNAESNYFAYALEEVVDPRVRQLGLDLISAGWRVAGIGLLVTNAVRGDEPFLASTARELTDEDDLHYAGMDFLRMSKELDVRDLILWVHEETPCSFCRESATRDLIEMNAALESLLRECLMDCVKDTRELAEKALAAP